ncbi:MAG TPA: CDP-alcohol phosphatidyltransferase family protein [Blastocatellia bacterium]|nr:CDP-alcohol phosphatidyltransferase family protein [Blastocatellia bacterium]
MALNQQTNEAKTAPPVRSRVWTVANLLTVLRILLILPFLYFIYAQRFGVALAVFFVASITDYADGYIARNFDQKTRLGQVLDPLADKLLTTASFVVMALPHEGIESVPVWLAVAVISRDLLILIGSLIVNRITGFTEFKPTQLGKINTFLELGLIVVFLAFHTTGVLLFLLPLCYAVVFASVLASSAGYVIQGAQILKAHKRIGE